MRAESGWSWNKGGGRKGKTGNCHRRGIKAVTSSNPYIRQCPVAAFALVLIIGSWNV